MYIHLSNILFFHRLQGLDDPIEYQGADVGRCKPAYYESATGEPVYTTENPSFTITVTRPESSTQETTEPQVTIPTTPPGPTVVS